MSLPSQDSHAYYKRELFKSSQSIQICLFPLGIVQIPVWIGTTFLLLLGQHTVILLSGIMYKMTQLTFLITPLIDAKNRRYVVGNPRPNLHQMRSYMRILGARYGIFIHSESENPSLWKEIRNEADHQNIIWTSVIPGSSDIISAQNLEQFRIC
jgi:hypothetical protein